MSEPRYLCHECGAFLEPHVGAFLWCPRCSLRRRVPTHPALVVVRTTVLRVADERDVTYERAARESFPTVAAERERYGRVDDLARDVADERDVTYERAARESFPTVAAAERERYGRVDDLAREAYGRQWGTSARAKRARERGA